MKVRFQYYTGNELDVPVVELQQLPNKRDSVRVMTDHGPQILFAQDHVWTPTEEAQDVVVFLGGKK